MAKGTSSASSGTRKKVAAKKAAKSGNPSSNPDAPPPAQRGQKKKDKVKRGVAKPYTPPPKAPAPPVPDPVDKMGLASTLDSELVVVLRKLGKKDSVTRRRAIESLGEWLKKVEQDREAEEWWVELIGPVWLHHLPSFLLTPSLLPSALTVHQQLLDLSPSLLENGLVLLMPHQQRNALALLLSTSLQNPRSTLSTSAIDLTDSQTIDMLVDYWEQAIFSPDRVWESVFPTIVSVDKNSGGGKPDKGYKGRLPTVLPPTAAESPDVALEEQETLERETNLTQGALLSLASSLSTLPSSSDLPESLHNLLKTSQLYSTLSSPQSLVRKSAWRLVGVLAEKWESVCKEMIESLSVEVGRNAWSEQEGTVRASMGEPVVLFFKKFPDTWELPSPDADDEDDIEEEAAEDDTASPTPKAVKIKTFPTYDSFLTFLQSGCRGAAEQSYPLLVILLSTLPESVLPLTQPAISAYLSSVWTGFDALPAADSPARKAFYTSILESLSLFLSRASSSLDIYTLLAEQVERTWKDCVLGAVIRAQGAGKRRVFGRPLGARGVAIAAQDEDLEPGEGEAKTLARWIGKIDDQTLLPYLWTSIRAGTASLLDGPTAFPLHKLGGVLAILGANLPPTLSEAFVGHLAEVARRSVGGLMLDLDDEDSDKDWIRGRMGLVGELIERKGLGEVLRHDDMFTQVVDALLEGEPENVLTTLPDSASARLYRVYFSWRQDSECTKEAFSALCEVLASDKLDKPLKFGVIKSLLDELAVVGDVQLVEKGEPGKLDGVCRALLKELRVGKAAEEDVEVLQSLMNRPRSLLSNDTLEELIEGIFILFNQTVFSFLHSDSTESNLNVALLYGVLTLVESIFLRRPLEVFIQSEVARQTLPSIYETTYLVPLLLSESPETAALQKKATYLWKAIENGSGALDEEIIDLVTSDVRRLVENTDSRLPSEAIMDAIPQTRYLPSSSDITAGLKLVTRNPLPPALAVNDALVSQVTEGPSRAKTAQTDAFGLSSFARLASVALAALSADRTLLKDDPSWLYFLSTFSLIAADELALPGSANHIFAPTVSASDLERFVSVADGLRSYGVSTLTGSLDPSWHQTTIAGLQKGSSAGDPLSTVLASLVKDVQGDDAIYSSRVLRDLLATVLHAIGAGSSEAEKWVAYGRTLQDKAPQLSLSIIFGAKDLCLDSPILQRLQNELAADLTGLKPADINIKGLRSLRLLAAAAPPSDSTAIFLPERRTVVLMQTLQGWMTGDEELDEEVDSRVAEVFSHLVPIAQNDLGAHWEFVFDLLESNLDAASWEDASTLPFLAHTLRLLATVRDLAAANKALRELWVKRKDASLAFVFDLFMSESDRSPSVPLATCRDLIVDLMDELQPSGIEGDKLAKLFTLLNDPSYAVQSTAHQLLQEVIHLQTADLVVKAATEREDGETDLTLPVELLNLIKTAVDVQDVEGHSTQAFGSLLAWDLLFEYFEDASLKLKTSYIEQLRNHDLVTASLLPSVFSILGVSGSRNRPFELAPWAVDEFMLELYDTDASAALALFAAHLYYRALLRVPSLIRTWWLELKDRQLSLSVQQYTSRNFAPYIISHELSTLREPAALADLQDDSLTVKILPAVNEVTASYVVDEQTMEIAVRLPSEYPLKPVEVKDIRRVGVDERKWKAWLLAVQQVVTNRDGLVLDALTLFKRNVSLHFAGVTECAICYSIISVNDRSLPNRSCKTCDNTFHASCLYKWFNTSHSSSCPLCRSLF